MIVALLFCLQEIDLSKYDPSCGVAVEKVAGGLRAGPVTLSLAEGKPLIASLDGIVSDVEPVFTVTVGSRRDPPSGNTYVFFDKPADRPHQAHRAELRRGRVQVESAGKRVAITLEGLKAGPFAGELVVRLYADSPLVHFEAAMAPGEDKLAYIYDFVLEGAFANVAWKRGAWEKIAPEGGARAVAVDHRVIFTDTERGSVAVFPPPHAWFFPRDWTNNFKFAQVGRGRFGFRQDPAGGGGFVPWVDAPKAAVQRMGAFVRVSRQCAKDAIAEVLRYTNGDAFKPMEGRLTFTSHWHSRIAVKEMEEKPTAPELVRVFEAMGVNLVHLAEFHGDGNPDDPGPKRLPQLKAMFDVCRKYSNDRVLLIPGEEWNRHLGNPAPKEHPGHWMYLFPKPVYLAKVRAEGAPFVEKVEPYGDVYRVGSRDDMVEVLKREGGLAWAAHPRIKASYRTPDAFKDLDFYKDDRWVGGAWKAMPADLSSHRLGVRALDCLDDMCAWGQKKKLLGEVDVFEIDRSHELYGHMNINYLRLAKKPTVDDWSGVLGALKAGDFFVTTGEVLIHAFDVKGGKASCELEWTFPLRSVELVADGKRKSIAMAETKEFGRASFEWEVDASATWVRLEVWDVAGNGAFTQPAWR